MEEQELNINQASAQPMPEDPNAVQGSAPDEEDISDIIGMLNEMSSITGEGEGGHKRCSSRNEASNSLYDSENGGLTRFV